MNLPALAGYGFPDQLQVYAPIAKPISDGGPPGLEFSQFQETPSRDEVKDIFLLCCLFIRLVLIFRPPAP
jgi:hypothetical protein